MKEEEKNHETTGKKTTLTDKIYQDIKDFIFVFQLGLNEAEHQGACSRISGQRYSCQAGTAKIGRGKAGCEHPQ